jgi:hypothetical protein
MEAIFFFETSDDFQRVHIATCFHAGMLLGLFEPEDGGDMFP